MFVTISLFLQTTDSRLVTAYTSPFFLQQILTSLTKIPGEVADPDLKTSAYVYATVALIAQIVRAEVDLQQLWSERRAIVRTRSLMMGMVYEKALKRKDGSGVVIIKESTEGKSTKSSTEKGKDSKKPTASSSGNGKIVQLMASDGKLVFSGCCRLSLITFASYASR